MVSLYRIKLHNKTASRFESHSYFEFKSYELGKLLQNGRIDRFLKLN